MCCACELVHLCTGVLCVVIAMHKCDIRLVTKENTTSHRDRDLLFFMKSNSYFPRPSSRVEPTQPPVKRVLDLFPEGKASEAWR